MDHEKSDASCGLDERERILDLLRRVREETGEQDFLALVKEANRTDPDALPESAAVPEQTSPSGGTSWALTASSEPSSPESEPPSQPVSPNPESPSPMTHSESEFPSEDVSPAREAAILSGDCHCPLSPSNEDEQPAASMKSDEGSAVRCMCCSDLQYCHDNQPRKQKRMKKKKKKRKKSNRDDDDYSSIIVEDCEVVVRGLSEEQRKQLLKKCKILKADISEEQLNQLTNFGVCTVAHDEGAQEISAPVEERAEEIRANLQLDRLAKGTENPTRINSQSEGSSALTKRRDELSESSTRALSPPLEGSSPNPSPRKKPRRLSPLKSSTEKSKENMPPSLVLLPRMPVGCCSSAKQTETTLQSEEGEKQRETSADGKKKEPEEKRSGSENSRPVLQDKVGPVLGEMKESREGEAVPRVNEMAERKAFNQKKSREEIAAEETSEKEELAKKKAKNKPGPKSSKRQISESDSSQRSNAVDGKVPETGSVFSKKESKRRKSGSSDGKSSAPVTNEEDPKQGISLSSVTKENVKTAAKEKKKSDGAAKKSSSSLKVKDSEAARKEAKDSRSGRREAKDSGAGRNEAKDSESGRRDGKDSEASQKRANNAGSDRSEEKDSESSQREGKDSEASRKGANDSESDQSKGKNSEASRKEAKDSESSRREGKDSKASRKGVKVSESDRSEDEDSGASQREAKDSEASRREAVSESGQCEVKDSGTSRKNVENPLWNKNGRVTGDKKPGPASRKVNRVKASDSSPKSKEESDAKLEEDSSLSKQSQSGKHLGAKEQKGKGTVGEKPTLARILPTPLSKTKSSDLNKNTLNKSNNNVDVGIFKQDPPKHIKIRKKRESTAEGSIRTTECPSSQVVQKDDQGISGRKDETDVAPHSHVYKDKPLTSVTSTGAEVRSDETKEQESPEEGSDVANTKAVAVVRSSSTARKPKERETEGNRETDIYRADVQLSHEKRSHLQDVNVFHLEKNQEKPPISQIIDRNTSRVDGIVNLRSPDPKPNVNPNTFKRRFPEKRENSSTDVEHSKMLKTPSGCDSLPEVPHGSISTCSSNKDSEFVTGSTTPSIPGPPPAASSSNSVPPQAAGLRNLMPPPTVTLSSSLRPPQTGNTTNSSMPPPDPNFKVPKAVAPSKRACSSSQNKVHGSASSTSNDFLRQMVTRKGPDFYSQEYVDPNDDLDFEPDTGDETDVLSIMYDPSNDDIFKNELGDEVHEKRVEPDATDEESDDEGSEERSLSPLSDRMKDMEEDREIPVEGEVAEEEEFFSEDSGDEAEDDSSEGDAVEPSLLEGEIADQSRMEEARKEEVGELRRTDETEMQHSDANSVETAETLERRGGDVDSEMVRTAESDAEILSNRKRPTSNDGTSRSLEPSVKRMRTPSPAKVPQVETPSKESDSGTLWRNHTTSSQHTTPIGRTLVPGLEQVTSRIGTTRSTPKGVPVGGHTCGVPSPNRSVTKSTSPETSQAGSNLDSKSRISSPRQNLESLSVANAEVATARSILNFGRSPDARGECDAEVAMSTSRRSSEWGGSTDRSPLRNTVVTEVIVPESYVESYRLRTKQSASVASVSTPTHNEECQPGNICGAGFYQPNVSNSIAQYPREDSKPTAPPSIENPDPPMYKSLQKLNSILPMPLEDVNPSTLSPLETANPTKFTSLRELNLTAPLPRVSPSCTTPISHADADHTVSPSREGTNRSALLPSEGSTRSVLLTREGCDRSASMPRESYNHSVPLPREGFNHSAPMTRESFDRSVPMLREGFNHLMPMPREGSNLSASISREGSSRSDCSDRSAPMRREGFDRSARMSREGSNYAALMSHERLNHPAAMPFEDLPGTPTTPPDGFNRSPPSAMNEEDVVRNDETIKCHFILHKYCPKSLKTGSNGYGCDCGRGVIHLSEPFVTENRQCNYTEEHHKIVWDLFLWSMNYEHWFKKECKLFINFFSKCSRHTAKTYLLRIAEELGKRNMYGVEHEQYWRQVILNLRSNLDVYVSEAFEELLQCLHLYWLRDEESSRKFYRLFKVAVQAFSKCPKWILVEKIARSADLPLDVITSILTDFVACGPQDDCRNIKSFAQWLVNRGNPARLSNHEISVFKDFLVRCHLRDWAEKLEAKTHTQAEVPERRDGGTGAASGIRSYQPLDRRMLPAIHGPSTCGQPSQSAALQSVNVLSRNYYEGQRPSSTQGRPMLPLMTVGERPADWDDRRLNNVPQGRLSSSSSREIERPLTPRTPVSSPSTSWADQQPAVPGRCFSRSSNNEMERPLSRQTPVGPPLCSPLGIDRRAASQERLSSKSSNSEIERPRSLQTPVRPLSSSPSGSSANQERRLSRSSNNENEIPSSALVLSPCAASAEEGSSANDRRLMTDGERPCPTRESMSTQEPPNSALLRNDMEKEEEVTQNDTSKKGLKGKLTKKSGVATQKPASRRKVASIGELLMKNKFGLAVAKIIKMSQFCESEEMISQSLFEGIADSGNTQEAAKGLMIAFSAKKMRDGTLLDYPPVIRVMKELLTWNFFEKLNEHDREAAWKIYSSARGKNIDIIPVLLEKNLMTTQQVFVIFLELHVGNCRMEAGRYILDHLQILYKEQFDGQQRNSILLRLKELFQDSKVVDSSIDILKRFESDSRSGAERNFATLLWNELNDYIGLFILMLLERGKNSLAFDLYEWATSKNVVFNQNTVRCLMNSLTDRSARLRLISREKDYFTAQADIPNEEHFFEYKNYWTEEEIQFCFEYYLRQFIEKTDHVPHYGIRLRLDTDAIVPEPSNEERQYSVDSIRMICNNIDERVLTVLKTKFNPPFDATKIGSAIVIPQEQIERYKKVNRLGKASSRSQRLQNRLSERILPSGSSSRGFPPSDATLNSWTGRSTAAGYSNIPLGDSVVYSNDSRHGDECAPAPQTAGPPNVANCSSNRIRRVQTYGSVPFGFAQQDRNESSRGFWRAGSFNSSTSRGSRPAFSPDCSDDSPNMMPDEALQWNESYEANPPTFGNFGFDSGNMFGPHGRGYASGGNFANRRDANGRGFGERFTTRAGWDPQNSSGGMSGRRASRWWGPRYRGKR